MSFWDRFLEEARTLGELIVEWAVLVVVALVVLIVGRWLLKLIRNLIERILGTGWLDQIWDRSGIKSALEPSGQTAASITATVVYAYLMIVLFLIVARILQLDTIVDLLERLLLWVPQLILAALIVIVAAAAANWTAELVRPFAEDRGVGWLDNAVRIVIIVFGVIFALDVVEITFAEDVTLILIAAAAVALAIAFGVGGIDAGKQWWAKYGTPSKIGSATRDDMNP